MVNERLSNSGRCNLLEGNCPNQLRKSVGYHQEVLVSSGCMDEFTQDIDTHILQWSFGWEELQLVRILAQLHAILRARDAVAYYLKAVHG